MRIRFILDGREVSEKQWRNARRKKQRRLGLHNDENALLSRVKSYQWPIISDVYGVLPNQIEQAKRIDAENGTPMKYVERGPHAGAMVIESRRQFDLWKKRRIEAAHVDAALGKRKNETQSPGATRGEH